MKYFHKNFVTKNKTGKYFAWNSVDW